MPEGKTTEVILALDVKSRSRAETVIETAGNDLLWIKIGLQSYLRDGPGFIRDLAAQGKKVFLDLKLHDIPNTMAKAIESLADLPVSMLTIHASAGPEAAARCSETIALALPDTTLLAVTVLTSMDGETLRNLGVEKSPEDQVVNLATLAAEAGVGGIVCSPREIHPLRAVLPADIALVTPGIRPAGSALDDQKRVMTPAEAARAGANYLVIGRPILAAEDPAAALAVIRNELNSANQSSAP